MKLVKRLCKIRSSLLQMLDFLVAFASTMMLPSLRMLFVDTLERTAFVLSSAKLIAMRRTA
jgi:hypothetical protein